MRFSGLTLIVALLASTIASALPQKPQGSYVYDEDRLMNSRQIDFFDRLSKELLDKTGICVAAVIVDDIEHADARTYASRIATEWNESSNGTILIFAAIKQRKRIVEAAGTAEGLLSVHESERLQQEAASVPQPYREDALLRLLRRSVRQSLCPSLRGHK